ADQAQKLVGRPFRAPRRCCARTAAEYRPRRRLRHDECAVACGLSGAGADVNAALQIWERNERPITEHTQRISYLLGLPTTWPPALRAAALGIAGRSKWLTAQRTRTALHRPTGT